MTYGSLYVVVPSGADAVQWPLAPYTAAFLPGCIPPPVEPTAVCSVDHSAAVYVPHYGLPPPAGYFPPEAFPPSPPESYQGELPPLLPPMTLTEASAALLPSPPSTPPPPAVPWVRVACAAREKDPRVLAVVYDQGAPVVWNKQLQLDKGLVAVHVRHENFTVEPAFPGPIERLYRVDPQGVLHVCIAIKSFKSQVDYGMYLVWISRFAELFNNTGQHWALVPQSVGAPKPSQIWRSFTTGAKIRFCCGRCGNAWTSMHGQVTFQYFLDRAAGAGTVLFQLYGQKCRCCVRRARAATASAAAASDTAQGTTVAGSGRGPAAAGAAASSPAAVPADSAAAGGSGDAAATTAATSADEVPYANPMWYPDEVERVLRELYLQVINKLYLRLPTARGPGVRRLCGPPRFGRPQQPHDAALCQGCSAGTCRMLRRS